MVINFHKVNLKYRRLIKKIFAIALLITQNNDIESMVDISFVNENEIQQLNQKHRNVDKVTDVLSFPMLNINYNQKLTDFKEELLPNGCLYLGDIVICKNKAKQQAKEYGHAYKREIAFLALHGFLHLLGYDHIDGKDEKVMKDTCENILSSLNIKRGKNV